MTGERKEEEEDVSESRVGSLVRQKMYSDGGSAPGWGRGATQLQPGDLCGVHAQGGQILLFTFFKETRTL